MTKIPTGAAWRPYLSTLADAGLDVASVGVWVAAAELPPARRRLARGAVAAVIGAVAIPGIRAARSAATGTDEPAVPGAGSGLPYVDVGIHLPAGDPSEDDASPRRRAVLAGAVGVGVLTTAVAASVGVTVAGRQLERRWLARLTRHGHPHPHRALALRMAGLYAALTVPSRLIAVRQGTKAGRRIAGG
ncbi:hypothetical protein ACQP2Y_35270 [Actinoplanes sp. CA-051413]|uniref:hypothetical protein n=1 Tax=Actinoplanes sp. CA-051413 TaxID=3239899 RepID=UPI003D974EE4